MNKTYKSVWNESTGTWVAVSELQKGRSKSKRAKTAIATAILAQVAVGGLSLAGASAYAAVTEGSATGTNATAIGTDSLADVTDGIAIGTGAIATPDTGPNASKTGAVAIGSGAEGDGSGVAIGSGTYAGSDSLALGANASASLQSVAIGSNARAFNTSAMALGDSASASAAQSLAIGANTNATATGAVALGANSTASRANTISVGSASIKRQITNVADASQDNDAVNLSQLKKLGLTTDSSGVVNNAFVAYDAGSAKALVTLGGASGTKITNLMAGTVGASSKDAVNGSQLYNVASSAANALGGGSVVNADGTVTKPTFKVNGQDQASLQDALNAAASSGTGGGGNGTDLNAVHYDDQSKKDKVTLGTAGTPVKVTNVAAGTSDLDAVNKKQLSDTDTKIRSDFSSLTTSTKYIGFGPTTAAQAQASGADAVAIGGNAFANGTRTLAIGANAVVSGTNSVAIGYGSQASDANTVSVGTSTAGRRIVNVAEGTKTTDAVNLGQVQDMFDELKTTTRSAPGQSRSLLITQAAAQTRDVPQSSLTPDQLIASGPTDKVNQISALGSDSISIGLNTRSDGSGSVAVGSNVSSVGENSISVGNLSVANGSGSQSFGYRATSLSDHGLALGNTATVLVDSPDAIAIGTGANAGADSATALGNGAVSAGAGTYVLGNNSTAFAASSIVLGDNSVVGKNNSATNKNSVAIGTKNTVSGSSTFVLGNTVTAAGSNSVVLGEKSDGSQSNVISVGAKGSERKIVNVATGTADTDAVNVKQLTDALGSVGGSADGVNYDTPAHNKITLGGTGSTTPVSITNVAAGTAPSDAVNVKQLTDAGLKTDSSGNVTNSFVAYDDATKAAVTLGGTNGTQIHNVAAGTTAKDAVNLGQLQGLGATVDSLGNVTNSFVAYDDTTKGKVTFGGTGSTTPVVLANVAAGKADTDAVNVKQLNALGAKTDSSGNPTNAFVAYDSLSTKDKVTLEGTSGTKITNLTAGDVSSTSKDAINGSQLYKLGSTTAAALGGGAALNPDGTIKAPTYNVAGTDYADVGKALDAVAKNGAGTDSVKYDTSAHDTVTLGGTSSTTPVTVTNVAAGKGDTDAVNVKQLTDAGLKTDSSGNVTNSFVAYDDTTKAAVTLGGTNGTQIHNVAAGTTAKDAVNLGQLQGLGATVDSSGNVTNSFVAYDDTTKGKVTFGGKDSTTPVVLANVAAGKADTDAVNVKQLNALGAKTDSSGNPTNAFVAYDNLTTKDKVTLEGTSGTKITNLTAGAISASSKDAINGSQLYNLGSTTAAALGGGAALNPDGTIKAPTYNVAGKDYTDVGQALGAVAQNGTTDAVKYDTSAHDKVTLGGTSSTTPVTLANVAAGKADTDAVNVKQLNDIGVKTDSSGNVTNPFVAYDDATKAAVTLGGTNGTQIHNVAAGTTAKDAVNLGQLQGLGATVDSSGNVTNSFVAYDDTTKGKVTFGGKGSTTPVVLANVAAGKAGTDAVNVNQLEALGGKLDSLGNATNAFVAYDNATKAAVTLGGTNGTQIHNVAAGTTAKDAVNLGQLQGLGATVDSSGNVTNSFVAYDDTTKGKVTFGGTGSTTPVTLANVAAGKADTDAVNVKQLNAFGVKTDSSGNVTNAFVAYDSLSTKDKVTLEGTSGTKITNLTAGDVSSTSKDAINGSQLYKLGSTTAAALGGGAALNPDGTIKAPTYNVAGTDYADVGKALDAVAKNGAGTDSVKYDTPSHDKITLGGTAAPAPVKLTNVADGVDATDAATVGQLNSLATDFKSVNTSLKYVRFGASVAATAQASGTDSVAIGGNAFANAAGALAIGRDAVASGKNSVAIGIGSQASQPNVVSFGSATVQRRLTQVADAQDDFDAVNLGQVTQLIADSKAKSTRSLTMMSQSVTQLAASTITPADMIKAGPTDKQGQIEALGTDSVAIGLNTHANGDQSVAIGTNTSAGNAGSVAIGNSAVSSGVGSTAIGVNAEATNGARALAIGNYAQSGSTDSIVIGNNSVIGDTANTTTDNAIAVGSKNKVTGANSVVLGNNVSVTGTSSFVLGSNTKVAGVNSVILGAGSDGSQSNVVSVGAKGSERKIVNVATGTAETDAVNVKQLNDKVAGLGTGGGTSLVTQSAADQDVLVAAATAGTHVNFAGTAGPRELTGVAAGTGDNSAATVGQLKPAVAALGGGAAVGADGKVTGPTYNVQGGTQNNVGAALGALDSGLNDVKTQIGKVGTSLVTQDTPTSAITVGALTGGTELNIANKDGVARKITNVAAGEVSSDSLNAINGSQLFSAGQGLATAIGGGAALNKDGSITQPTFVVGGTSVHNVGDALSNIDGRVTSNTTDIAGIKQTLTTIGSSANSVTYDSTAHNKVTLGGTAATTSTSLTNLTDANLSATSTDAVTGKQLYATNAKVDELGTAIKNVSTTGSSVVAVGPIDAGSTGPAPTATGSGSLAVGNGANAGGDGSLALGNGAGAAGNGGVAVGAGSSSGGKDSLALGHNAQAPADNAVALGANSVADQPNTVSIGSEGNERRLTNVAPGINGTDAVNMNQLGAVQSGLNDVARKSYGGIAAATALTMIPDVDANKTLSIGVGGGTYRGYAATAIGGTARITQNIKVRVGAGWSSSGTTVGAGASYQW